MARVSGVSGVVLVGDPVLYTRYGFCSNPHLTYAGVPHQYVLGLSCKEIHLCGEIQAHCAFEEAMQ